MTEIRTPKNFKDVFSIVLRDPKGQESIAQGLPWVNFPSRIGPEGAVRYGIDRLPIGPMRVPISEAPSVLRTFFWLTQGKPWLSYLGPSGRMTGAKHIQLRCCGVSPILVFGFNPYSENKNRIVIAAQRRRAKIQQISNESNFPKLNYQ
jgi:hypothetical protein